MHFLTASSEAIAVLQVANVRIDTKILYLHISLWQTLLNFIDIYGLLVALRYNDFGSF